MSKYPDTFLSVKYPIQGISMIINHTVDCIKGISREKRINLI